MANALLALQLLGTLLTQALGIGTAIASAQASGTDITAAQLAGFVSNWASAKAKLDADIATAQAALAAAAAPAVPAASATPVAGE